jgi:hypothetical protein
MDRLRPTRAERIEIVIVRRACRGRGAREVAGMKTNPYDVLLEERRTTPAEIARRRDAERSAEIARNLESLGKLAEIEASDRELATGPADPGEHTGRAVEIDGDDAVLAERPKQERPASGVDGDHGHGGP